MKNTERIRITPGASDLPHDWETERALLGSILMDYRVLDDVRYRVTESDFSRQQHAELFLLTKKITDKTGMCDIALVVDYATREGLDKFGGASHILGLANAAPTPEFAPAYADRVHELACIRRTVLGVKGVIEVVRNGASFREMVAELERVTTDAGGSSLSTDAAWSHLIEGVDEAYEETRKAYETGESPPYLRTGISELDEHLNAGPGDLVVVAARPAMGKAQPVDCNVLTPSGFVKIGSLRVGDKVIGSNGKPTTVLGVYPQGVKKVYRVKMSDGGETRCCDEHLWFTQTRNDRRFGRGYFVRSLREIAETIRIEGGSRFNHNIPIVGQVDFGRNVSLPLHPWVLGAFIGDGSTSSGSVRFSKPERDVYERFADLLPDDDALSVRGYGIDCVVRRAVRRSGSGSRTRAILTDLQLHGKRSHERHIPEQYLFAGIEDRIELLRGLCDTDGYVTSGQAVEYTTTSPHLARDFLFLVRSLGGLASMAVKKPTYSYKGEHMHGRDAYRFVVSFPNGLVPVSSNKHIKKWSESPKPYRLRQVDTVTPAGEAECVCIAVDAPDHLYVTDDFIVTHNTVYADQWAGHVAKHYGSVGFFSLEMPKRQIGQRNLARQSGVGLKAITDGRNILRHEIEDLVRARNDLTDLSFFVDDLPSLSPATLKMKVRALKRKLENEGRPALVMVVIDYLQLADVEDSGSDNRTVAIGRFTRMCKVLARDENIVVVLVSQLNRSLESRTNKRPIPSDLRESGSIEQDADSILFIYRDEVYDPASADKGMAELIIAKQRQGSLATAKVPFSGAVSRFGGATQTGATRMVGNG